MPSERSLLRRKYSPASTARKQKERALKLWRQLQYEGIESLEELQHVAEELKVPKSWQGMIGGCSKAQPGTEDVTADDLWPSRGAIENLVTRLKKRKDLEKRD